MTQIVSTQNSIIVLQKPATKTAGTFPLILQLLFVNAFIASVAICNDTKLS